MADRRYSTARWQRLRNAILARDSGICTIQGPRCTGGRGHRRPHLPEQHAPAPVLGLGEPAERLPALRLRSGARIQADNRRRQIAQLEQLVEQQAQQITELLAKLAAYEDGSSASATFWRCSMGRPTTDGRAFVGQSAQSVH
jgi:hypothetical protein